MFWLVCPDGLLELGGLLPCAGACPVVWPAGCCAWLVVAGWFCPACPVVAGWFCRAWPWFCWAGALARPVFWPVVFCCADPCPWPVVVWL